MQVRYQRSLGEVFEQDPVEQNLPVLPRKVVPGPLAPQSQPFSSRARPVDVQ